MLLLGQNEADYLGIISAAKGNAKSKQLAAQLIPRFFKHFPTLSSQAINAQLDLCEEDELGVSTILFPTLTFSWICIWLGLNHLVRSVISCSF